MKKYTYNANDDELKAFATCFSNRLGDETGDHEAEYLDMLKLLIALKQHGSLLDIGTGIGRVLAMATGKIAEIVAIEPDYERFSNSYKAYDNPPYCRVLHQDTSDFIKDNPDKKFDLIVLGMVIQHVATNVCTDLMRDIAHLLRSDGVAIVATTHTLEETKGFSYQKPKQDDHYIPEQVFNAYANSVTEQTKGIPVRRFSQNDLFTCTSPYFEPLHWRQFSYYRPEKIGWFATQLGIEGSALENTGASQFVVLAKR